MVRPTVAILGASTDRSKFGNKSVRAHARAGYDVFPVNPKGGQIEGLTVYRSLREIPLGKSAAERNTVENTASQRLDRISVYLPPPVGLAMLDEIAEVGCDELFLNPGSSSPELVARAQSLGLHVVQGCSIVDVGASPVEFP